MCDSGDAPTYEERIAKMNAIISAEDAAYILGCSSTKVLRMARSNLIDSFKVDKVMKFRRDSIIAYTGTTYEDIVRSVIRRQELLKELDEDREKRAYQDADALADKLVSIFR